MSLLFKRAASSGQVAPGDPLAGVRDARMGGLGPVDTKSAMQTVAYFACIDLVASLVSTTPLEQYRTAGEDQRPMPLSSWLNDPAGDGQGLEDWLYQCVISMLSRGNIVGEVLARDANAYPTQITLLDFERIGVKRVDGQLQWTSGGKPIPTTANVWHRRAYSMPGALVGLSPLEMHAATLGQHIAARKFGSDFFGNDAHPVAVLESEQPIDQTTAREIKDRVKQAIAGRDFGVLGKGLHWNPIQVTPEESQFLATQGYTAAEVARIFGPGLAEILGYDIGKSMTYANVESRSLHLQIYSIQKWFVRMERAISAILPKPQVVRFNLKAMMRATTLERYQAHQIGIASKFLLPDEAREEESMPPLPDGMGQTFPTTEMTPPITPPTPPAEPPKGK